MKLWTALAFEEGPVRLDGPAKFELFGVISTPGANAAFSKAASLAVRR